MTARSPSSRSCGACSTPYGFVEWLSDAIAAYNAGVEETDPFVFQYRGANLRYAVERSLYFRFVNDEDLYSRFLLSPASALDPTARATRLVDFVRERCRRVKAQVLRAATQAAADGPNPVLERVDRPAVLIHVIHAKFVRFLEPVIARSRLPYAYLLAAGSNHRSWLEAHEIPFVDCLSLKTSPSPSSWPAVGFECPEVTAWYDRVHAALSLLRPACVVLVEGNAPQDEVVNRACQALGIGTVCIQQGWSPIVHSGFRNMTYSRMAVWGEGFRDLLRPHNPDQEFVVTGHPRLPARQGRGPGGDDRRAIGFFLQAPGRLITREAWRDFLNLIHATGVAFPDRDILVREHPSHALDESERSLLASLPNLRMVSGDSLAAVLSRLAVAASIYSTVLLEAIAAGAVPVVVNLTSMPAYSPDIAANGAGVEVHSAEDACAVIGRLLTDEPYRRSFGEALDRCARRYFADPSTAADRIAALIADTAGSTADCRRVNV